MRSGKTSGWKKLSRFVLAVTVAGTAVGCSPGGLSQEERIARVETGLVPGTGEVIAGRPVKTASLRERMAAYKIPAVSIAVIEDFRVAWARGYGATDLETGRPVSPRTLFQAASISKPVAAAAALRLVERGRLNLEEDVNRYLGSWKVPANEFTARRPVTLRGLLSHTAGLTVHGFRGYAAGDDLPTLTQILDGAPPANSAAVRVDVLPGSLWRYSGGGYTVLQQMLSDVTGRAFPGFLQEEILKPAGMEDSTFLQPLPEDRAEDAAAAHRMNGKLVPGRWHVYPENAAAGLWTTPTDLCRFALEVMGAWRGETGRVMTPETARRMLTEVDGGYGLGFVVRGEDRDFFFGHGGGNEGYICQLLAWPVRGQGAAVMTNGDFGSLLCQEILRGLAREYDWPEFRLREREPAALPPGRIEALAGTYRLQPSGTLILRPDGDHLAAEALIVSPGGRQRVEFFPASADSFFAVDTPAEIRFEFDSEGKATGLVLRERRRKRRGVRIDGEADS